MFLSRQHRMALELLIYGLRNQAMFCVVCGDIGTGKTTLMRYLLSRHGPRISVGMVTGVNGTFTELMQWMLSEFGARSPRAGQDRHAASVGRLPQATGGQASASCSSSTRRSRSRPRCSRSCGCSRTSTPAARCCCRPCSSGSSHFATHAAPPRCGSSPSGWRRLPPCAARQRANARVHPPSAGYRQSGPRGSLHRRRLRRDLHSEPRHPARHQSPLRHRARLRLRRPEAVDRRDHRERDARRQGARRWLALSVVSPSASVAGIG